MLLSVTDLFHSIKVIHWIWRNSTKITDCCYQKTDWFRRFFFSFFFSNVYGYYRRSNCAVIKLLGNAGKQLVFNFFYISIIVGFNKLKRIKCHRNSNKYLPCICLWMTIITSTLDANEFNIFIGATWRNYTTFSVYILWWP